ncbi:hypothetical protein [Methylobacterium sp. NEAU K]|uniref:hypothetical protein n=1 Tax=Methylobacterium sp. NEAU K TaxID=3064946 RepID=UPI002734DE7D|nr:hypothetical protein [Methylobacterium sp. NEAU K]MDP4002881.1 hypothetical protein [Methylobacterium sp. NEAU K]
MPGQPDNPRLGDLRRIDETVDCLSDDVRDLKGRMGAVVENLAGVHRRIDRVELRIERRLDLADAPH